MKKLIIVLGLILVVAIGCRDDDPEPQSTANMEDLLGTWVSLDSMLVQDTFGEYFYKHDTLEFRSDTLLGLYSPYAIYANKIGLGGFYSISYFGEDSLHFSYKGPTYIHLSPNIFRVKIFFSPQKDTINLNDLRKVYPYRGFNKFFKIK